MSRDRWISCCLDIYDSYLFIVVSKCKNTQELLNIIISLKIIMLRIGIMFRNPTDYIFHCELLTFLTEIILALAGTNTVYLHKNGL